MQDIRQIDFPKFLQLLSNRARIKEQEELLAAFARGVFAGFLQVVISSLWQ